MSHDLDEERFVQAWRGAEPGTLTPRPTPEDRERAKQDWMRKIHGPGVANTAEHVAWVLGATLTHPNLGDFRIQARDLAVLLLSLPARFAPRDIPDDLRGMFYQWSARGVVDRIQYEGHGYQYVHNEHTDQWCRAAITLLAPGIEGPT